MPPWGQMNETQREKIDKRPIAEAWRPLHGGDVAEEWKRWLYGLVRDLSAMLWPTFDETRRTWASPPNDALIDADFTLLESLWLQLNEPIKGAADENTLHGKLFDEEDDERILIGAQYERYDPSFPEHLRQEHTFTNLLIDGFDRKLGSLQLQLKQRFQRPRPYQVAFLQRRARFKHLSSRLGSHPSFISGHCIQGCLGGTSAYLLIGTVLDFASIDILKQFAVDIGDRRVFGGVHYPSDNLGSWYTAFKLLPHVIDSSVLPRARSFLWDAISTRSIVYRAIADYVHPDDGSSPYAPALAAIVAAANPHLPH